ncbi:Sister chromatid cohesion complex Cohesin, subunit RAD21/SCC1 [Ceraceosorus bombacis]|uniref:Sister chromatid cohesion complex Cohesin, subunit RAD21/SCC1 n=1 Tax=Ceraceosorus bombacis TaxID=401625 RepID=A0A0P1BNN0_9BASI|nr:Sister chromatid cohesion complex Cohesin, subunit RAD21/SCC1 [Ceraceosorus bombacis]
MFYSADILGGPRRGLGLVWLAATLGAKNAIRKLNKRDIATCDIGKTCEAVMNPKEPMALRLSSQLLYGVVRIYVQQSETWMAEVQFTHASLRKAFTIFAPASASGAPPGVRGAIDMPLNRRNHQAGKTAPGAADGITLPSNDAFFAGDFEFDWFWDEDGAGFGDTSTGVGSAFVPSASFETPSPQRKRYTADAEAITLRSALLSQRNASAEGHAGSELGRDGGMIHDAAVFQDDGDDEPAHLDLGLEVMDYNFPAPPSEGDGAQHRAMRSSSVLGGPEADFGAFDDLGDMGAPGDFDVEYLNNLPGMQEAEASRQLSPSASLRSALKRSATPSLIDSEEARALGLPIPPSPKKKRVTFKEDRRLELSDDEMRRNRSDYLLNMEKARAEAEAKRNKKDAEMQAERLVFGPSKDLAHGYTLSTFWRMTVDERFAELTTMRQAFQTPKAPTLPNVFGGPLPFAQENGQYDEGVDMFNDDAGMPPDDDGGVWDDLPGGPPSSSEIGRAESETATAKLPWNMAADNLRAAAEQSTVLSGTRSVGDGTLRSFAEGDISAIRGSRRDSSVIPPSPRLIREDSRLLETGSRAAQESQSQMESQLAIDTFKSESNNFLVFAHNTAAGLGDQPLFFSDLAPVADTTPGVAAQAFYHLLALATNDKISIEQNEAYGEIHIGLGDISGIPPFAPNLSRSQSLSSSRSVSLRP